MSRRRRTSETKVKRAWLGLFFFLVDCPQLRLVGVKDEKQGKSRGSWGVRFALYLALLGSVNKRRRFCFWSSESKLQTGAAIFYVLRAPGFCWLSFVSRYGSIRH